MIFRRGCGNRMVSRVETGFPAGIFEILATLPRLIRVLNEKHRMGIVFPCREAWSGGSKIFGKPLAYSLDLV